MYSRIEELISIAASDGQVTDNEKQMLLNKAMEMGLDMDEFTLILENKLNQLNNTRPTTAQPGNKCSSCGEVTDGVTKVCPACNAIMPQTKGSAELDKSISALEDMIAQIKAMPKPSVGDLLAPILLIYITIGIYIIYKRNRNEKIFKGNNKAFDAYIAECEKEIHKIEVQYGANSTIKKLLGQTKEEIALIEQDRKKRSTQAIMITVVITTALVVYSYIKGQH